jgi:selenocysteine lyase/cysteine desulfurase
VAVTAASNLIGTRPPIADIARVVHDAGALLYVDGVHATAHVSVDIGSLGADLYACSPYKFLGPHCGVAAGRVELLESLQPDKLLPATDVVPERFELGTLPYELLAGTTAAVDFLAYAPDDGGDRRARLVAEMAKIEAHEDGLRHRLEDGLASMPSITSHSHAACRTPTVLLTFEGRDTADAPPFLAERNINAPAGSFYALEPSRWLGLGDTGGLRIGFAPYNDADDVDRLLTALNDFVS